MVSRGPDGRRVLRLRVTLPGVEDKRHVDWQVQAVTGSSSTLRQLLVLHVGTQYALTLPLPVRVAGDAGKAEWAAGGHVLTITWPVL